MTPAFANYPFTAERHPAQLPELRDGLDVRRRPVVVVGGGPVGLTAAIGLANHGVPVVLLEADDSVCFGSRAICISRRSLEIADRLGALEGFLKIGLPWTGGRSFYRDQQVLHFKMPSDSNQRLPPMVNLAQYSIENILLQRALALGPLMDIRWSTKLIAIRPRDDGVQLEVSTPAGDYRIESDWVIAADGGRSFVRESLGLKLEGTTYEGRYVIVDILMDMARPTERLAYFDPPCNRGSTVLVHRQPDNVWRIDYQLREGEDPDEAIKPENVAPRVASLLEMMGETAPWQLIWTGLYKANALTLPSYRAGRVLLAGDAAHLVPIFGVRGANSGIDDADNLAWKLAFVIKGLAAGKLLDSYSAERVSAAHENLSYGTKSTEFMAPPSFAFELMRQAVLGLAATHPGLSSLINPRQTSAIAYRSSPLNAVDDDDEAFEGGPRTGAVLAECPLTIVAAGSVPRSAYLTEILCLPGMRGGFVALEFLPPGAQPSAALGELESELTRRGVVLGRVAIGAESPRAGASSLAAADHTGRLLPMYAATSGAVYLVRPDGHVLGRWRKPQAAALVRAIERALGR